VQCEHCGWWTCLGRRQSHRLALVSCRLPGGPAPPGTGVLLPASGGASGAASVGAFAVSGGSVAFAWGCIVVSASASSATAAASASGGTSAATSGGTAASGGAAIGAVFAIVAVVFGWRFLFGGGASLGLAPLIVFCVEGFFHCLSYFGASSLGNALVLVIELVSD